MNPKAEQLLEALLDLERSRQRERALRIESEALLEGLHRVTTAEEANPLFRAIVDVLHTVLDFEHALILQGRDDGSLTPVDATCDALRDTVWHPASVFQRVVAGRPVAVFDVAQVPEWSEQPPAVRESVTSALHIALRSGPAPAILVVTHRDARHFGPTHVRHIERFAPLASQALLTLDLRRAVTQRDRFFRLSGDLMGIVTFQGRFKQFNPAWERVLGYSESELRQVCLFDLVHAEQRDGLLRVLARLEETGEQGLVEGRIRCRDGSHRWLSCSLATYTDEQLFYVAARDVTRRVEMEQRLAKEARHDSLTGLFNRSAFLLRLKMAIAHAKRQPANHFAVLYLDLNKFKHINDTLGHHVGDELLKALSRCLLAEVREVDTVARLGGDEFAVLLADVTEPAGATCVTERIHRRWAVPLTVHGDEIVTSASIGITLSIFGYHDVDEMLRDADAAMYVAKSRGGDQTAIFEHPAEAVTPASTPETTRRV